MIKINARKRKLNISKVIIITIISLLIIAAIILISLYISEKDFREWIDTNIFKKNLTEEDVYVINLDTGKTNQVYVYSKYVALLNDKKITLYNNYGEEQTSIDVNVNSALFASNGKYLALAEQNGNEVYLIQDKTYLWNNQVEGKILQVSVNQNGYVAVITTDTTYKSILTLYDPMGKSLFRSFFKSTRIIDVSMSKDNKYIAIGELDASGALIQSNIKIISVDNAQNDAENAIVYTYNAESGKLIVNVEYQDKNKVVCMYDSCIDVIEDENVRNILNTEDSKISFMSVNFSNYMAYVEENSTGLFNSESNVKIVNTSSNQENLYTLDDIAKEIYTGDDIIAINVGTELYFIDTKGWLIKKYTANQEITNVMLSSHLSAIIYKDKIEIIDL